MAKVTSRKKRRKAKDLTAKSASSSSDTEGASDDDHEEEERNERRWQTRRCVSDAKGKGKEVVEEEDEESESGSEGVLREEQKEDPLKEVDQVCGICLSEGGNERGKLDCCDHFFCFNCIMEWAKVESRCPMCKQRFVTVMRLAASGVARSRNRTFRIPTRDQVYEPSEEEIRLFTDPYHNTVCIQCQEAGDEGLLLLCDRCDAAAHTYCVGLGRSVPRGDWFCQECLNGVDRAGSSEDEEEGHFGVFGDGEDPCETNSHWDLTVLVADVNAERNARSRRSAASSARPLRRSTRRRERAPRLPNHLLDISTESRSGFFPSLMEHYGVARTLFRQRQVQATVHTRLQNMRDNWNRFRSGESQFGSAVLDLRGLTRSGVDSPSIPSSSSAGRTSLAMRNALALCVDNGEGPNAPQPLGAGRSAEQTEVARAWAMMDQARRLEVRSSGTSQSVGSSSRAGPAAERQSREAKSQEVALPRIRDRHAHEPVLPGATSSRGGLEVFLNTRSANSSRDIESKENTTQHKTATEDNHPESSSRREVPSSRGGYLLREHNHAATNNTKDTGGTIGPSRPVNLRENRSEPEVLQLRSVLDDKDSSRGSSGRSTRRRDTNKHAKDSTALQVLSLLDDKDCSRSSGPSARRRETKQDEKESVAPHVLSVLDDKDNSRSSGLSTRKRETRAMRCPERDEEMKHLKEQCFNLVNVALKPFFDRGKIDKKQYKEIARLSTHALLASLEGSESKHGTDVSLGTVVCEHEALTSSDLIPGCCEPCVQRHVRKFVKNVVKEMVEC